MYNRGDGMLRAWKDLEQEQGDSWRAGYKDTWYAVRVTMRLVADLAAKEGVEEEQAAQLLTARLKEQKCRMGPSGFAKTIANRAKVRRLVGLEDRQAIEGEGKGGEALPS